MSQATRIVASTVGVYGGLLGIEHGIGETLQGYGAHWFAAYDQAVKNIPVMNALFEKEGHHANIRLKRAREKIFLLFRVL